MRTLAEERCPRTIPRTHREVLLWPSPSLMILGASPGNVFVAKCWPGFLGPSSAARLRGVVARMARQTKIAARFTAPAALSGARAGSAPAKFPSERVPHCCGGRDSSRCRCARGPPKVHDRSKEQRSGYPARC